MPSRAVFRKTPKGVDEVQHRSGKLTPRQRRILIMVDGKRTVEELRELASTDDLSNVLGHLEEEGYIELVGLKGENEAITRQDRLPSLTDFRPLPEPRKPEELDMARHFMINTIKAFCRGPIIHLSLIDEIAAAQSHEELRALYGQWFRLIQESAEGRRRAEQLRADLLKVL